MQKEFNMHIALKKQKIYKRENTAVVKLEL